MATKGLTHFPIQQLKDAGLFKFVCRFGTTRHEKANKIHVHDYPFYRAINALLAYFLNYFLFILHDIYYYIYNNYNWISILRSNSPPCVI